MESFKYDLTLVRATDELYRSIQDLNSIGVSFEKIAGTIYRSLGKDEEKISELVLHLKNCLSDKNLENVYDISLEEKKISSDKPILPKLPMLPMLPKIIKSCNPRTNKTVEETNEVTVTPFGEDRYKVQEYNFVVDNSKNFYGMAQGNEIKEANEQEKRKAKSLGFQII